MAGDAELVPRALAPFPSRVYIYLQFSRSLFGRFWSNREKSSAGADPRRYGSCDRRETVIFLLIYLHKSFLPKPKRYSLLTQSRDGTVTRLICSPRISLNAVENLGWLHSSFAIAFPSTAITGSLCRNSTSGVALLGEMSKEEWNQPSSQLWAGRSGSAHLRFSTLERPRRGRLLPCPGLAAVTAGVPRAWRLLPEQSGR